MDYTESNSKLWELAEKINSSIPKKFHDDIQLLNFLNEYSKFVNESVFLTGSCEEGSKVNTKNDAGDIDALIVSGNVSLDENLFEYVNEYPAFLKVKFEGDHKEFFTVSDVSNDGFILAEVLRSMNEKHFLIMRFMLQMLQMPQKSGGGFTYSQLSAVGQEKRTVLNENIPSGSLDEDELFKFDKFEAFRFLMGKLGHHMESSADKSKSNFGEFIKTNMDLFKKFTEKMVETIQESHEVIHNAVLVKSTDFVPAYAIKSGTWPRVAQDWIYRSRHWPPKDVVDAIIAAGCHVIAKPLPDLVTSGHYTGDGPDVYFRLSFSVSEVLLAKSMNEVQKMCWKILKAYQKGYLETSPKVLTSYHWKNIVFWLCETKEESFWDKENLLLAVKVSIDKMYSCLTERDLPQYFCRNMNLLRHCDQAIMNELKEKLTNINEDPLGHLENFLQNPPDAPHCSLDTNVIPSSSRNKLVETGHTAVCGIFSEVLKTQEDVNKERFAKCLKNVGNFAVNKTSDAYNKDNSTSPKSKRRCRRIQGAANKFLENVTGQLTEVNDGEEFKSLIKKESWQLLQKVGKTYIDTTTEDSDIDLD